MAATFDGHHLATGIEIQCVQTGAHRYMQQTGHMEKILNYLRLLEYAGIPANDPEQQEGDTYRLTIHLADGNAHIYHVHADRFLSENFRPWIKVESDMTLSALLQTIPDKQQTGASSKRCTGFCYFFSFLFVWLS